MLFSTNVGKVRERKLLFRWLIYFLTFNSLIIFGISVKYLKYIQLTDDLFVKGYFLISYISHFMMLGFLPLLICLPLVLFKIRLRYLNIIVIILAILFDSVLLVDAIIFDLYRFHMNSFVLDLLFGGAASQIFNIPALQYVWTVLFVLLLAGVIILLAGLSSKLINSRIFVINRVLLPVTIVFLISSHLIHAWADAAAFQPITKISRFYPLYFPLRASEEFYKMGIVDKAKIEKNKLKFNEHSNDLKYPLNPITFNEPEKKLNIIFIVLDSWHNQTMDSLITPNIYNLAKQSQLFKNHCSGSNGTRGGIFTMFYSIPALYWEDMLSTETSPVFITSLQKSGYDLSIHASSALSSPPFDRTVFRSVSNLKLGSIGNTACERDENLTKDFIKYLDSIKNVPKPRPFFAFLFYDAPHAIEHPKMKCPFEPEWPNPKYLSLDNNTDPTPFFNLYKNAVYSDDVLIGQVLQQLEKTGNKENSIIIVTGDHGQEFNDNHKNYWGHNGNFSHAQIGVPFIIYIPGKQPATYNHLSLHYDIVPTIMETVLGCKNKNDEYSCGHNLFDTTKRNSFIVGSRENFGIVSETQITTVFPNGSFSVTDNKMNELDNSLIDHVSTYKLITSINRFYKTVK